MADNDFGPFLENVYDEVDAKKELFAINWKINGWMIVLYNFFRDFICLRMYRNIKTKKR